MCGTDVETGRKGQTFLCPLFVSEMYSSECNGNWSVVNSETNNNAHLKRAVSNERVFFCSGSSMQWRYVSDEDRQRLSHCSEDGEFW